MTRAVGLLAACDDPKLLGFPLWPRQRELLAAIEGDKRLHVWAVGRRSGKTTLAALVAVHNCLFRPDLDAAMRPGERRYAVGIATNHAQARLLVAAARSIVEHSPLLADLIEAATDDELRFTNGTAVRAFPCSSRGGRGWPISCLILDEAAHFLTETDGYQTAERVWEALVPSTAQFGAGARIIAASTPWGTDGLFADLWNRAESGEIADALAQHATTAEVNPTITADFLALEEARDPDSFRAEYLAQFTGSGDAYLDFARFDVYHEGDLPPSHCVNWIAGLDPAFSRDPFGIALVGKHPSDRGKLIAGKVGAFKAAGEDSFDARLRQVADVCREYRARVVTDQYAAPAILAYLRREGLSVRQAPMSATSKTAIFGELRARLYDGSLEIPNDPALLAELRRLRSKFTAGQAAVVNPRVGGSHGDIAQALALAVHEHRGGGSIARMPRGGGYDGVTSRIHGERMPHLVERDLEQ